MTLSIVILTCNQWVRTQRLLNSLYPYIAGRDDTDAVIVDNGSSDGTLELFAQWLEHHPGVSDKIRLIPLSENRGVAAGRNVGFKNSGGELLMILDNDTIVNSKTLDVLRKYLEDHPGCGLCAPALLSPEGDIQDSAKPFPGPLVKLSHVLRPGKLMDFEKREMQKKHPWYVSGACQLIRRSTYEKIGPLDENIFYGPEDADYCARVRRIGLTVDYLPEVSIVHDWRRATRKNPVSVLGMKHAIALVYFWGKTIYYMNPFVKRGK